MADRHKVRITVLRRFSPREVFKKIPVTPVEPMEACEILKDGQEFVVKEDLKMPEGFCTSAWHSLYCNVRTLSFGADIPWYKEKGVAVNSCVDGLRPVVFKLERI